MCVVVEMGSRDFLGDFYLALLEGVSVVSAL